MKKNKSKFSNELEELGKELISLLPVNNLQKIFKQFEKFDGGTPETLLSKIKSKPLNFPQISDEKQKSFQDKFLNAVRSDEYASLMKTNLKENVKFIKEHLEKTDSRYALLINLLNKADKNVEFVSLPLLIPFLESERNFILFCKPIKLLEEINSNNGEKRKNFVIELFREIPEPLYYNYLEFIWRLSFLAENDIFPNETPKKFGNRVYQATHRLKNFPGLVESKIKLLRNSFIHKNFEYNLKDDSFILWDDKTPKTQMTTDEIVKIGKDATLMCVETFPLVAQLYLLRNFYLNSGLLDTQLQNIPALTSGNPLKISKAESEISAFAQLLTKPMRDFFQKYQSASLV